MKKKEFQKYLDLHKNGIYSQAWYILGNREDAEDVTQEAFVKLWKHWETIDKKKVRAWLMQVTHNLCMDIFRRRKNMRLQDVKAVTPERSDPYGYGDPESYVDRTEMQERLLQAMDHLPVRTREILLLHYFQDLPLHTIGEMLNIPLNTIKVTIHRGRKSLKNILFPDVTEDSATRIRERWT